MYYIKFFFIKNEKNVDNYKDLFKYTQLYLIILLSPLVFFFWKQYKITLFFKLVYFNYLTTFFLILMYIFIDPFKFTLSLSGFNKKKNWVKSSLD